MADRLTQERAKTWELTLRTIGWLIKTFGDNLDEAKGVPFAWYDVLVQLNLAPEGRLRMQALSDMMVLRRSGLTRLLDRMEQEGLVRREPSREDRRGFYAVLTEKGREVFADAQAFHHRDLVEHFSRFLSDSDINALNRIMSKVHEGNLAADEGGNRAATAS